MRNFPDFLDAYASFARDGFCPDNFHFWTGASIIAGALERRVWVSQDLRKTFPNLYVFLIAHPGEGKSSASDLGVREVLSSVRRNEKEGVSFLPNQLTDAAFIDSMSKWSKFHYNGEDHLQSAHFLYVSEAENSLKELQGGGEITAALTDFYDCQSRWVKKTVGKGESVLQNVCCNALVGCTYSYLNRMFPDSRVMGGFASRILYVVHTDMTVRHVKWTSGMRSRETKEKLIADLDRIYHLTGQFTVTPEFAQAFENWFPVHDAYRRGLKNERMQAFLARKNTNLLKMSMICSVSESDSLVLELRHWERAMLLMEEMERALPKILDAAATVDKQEGVNRIIASVLLNNGGEVPLHALKRELVRKGVDSQRALSSIDLMISAGLIKMDMVAANGAVYKFLGDPNEYI